MVSVSGCTNYHILHASLFYHALGTLTETLYASVWTYQSRTVFHVWSTAAVLHSCHTTVF